MNILKVQALGLLLMVSMIGFTAVAKEKPREFYQLKIYHLKNDLQEKRVDSYLKDAYLPALHRAGIKLVGVFKPVDLDTADRKLYVLIPFQSLEQFSKLEEVLLQDKQYNALGKDYIDATYDSPPFDRLESIILKSFSYMPVLKAPDLKTPRQERIYELRSYEGYTEKIFKNKVQMFNEGGEVDLFKRLGFNAVFYAEVMAGSRVPNLMYMTTFENKTSRDAHWKTFVDDPQWKKLSSMPEYQKNVSKIDIYFLRPTEYSDY